MKKAASASGNTKPAKAVTLSAVAKRAGVSVAAASCYFRGRLANMGAGTVGVGEETARAILRASRELGYVPADRLMRVRVYPEQGEFCYLFDRSIAEGIANSYHSRIFKGAVDVLGMERHLAFAQTDHEIDYVQEPQRLPELLRAGVVTRAIVAGTPNYSLIMALRNQGVRIAYASQNLPTPGVLSFAPDYEEAARLCLAHLFARGHRRIAVSAERYFGVPGYAARELMRGTQAAFKAEGLPFSPEDILYNQFGAGSRHEVIEGAIRRPARERPTAVFCWDDWTALNVLREAQAAGLAVPRDLSVIGVNDDARSANLAVPLTTIHLPAEEIGAAATQALLDPARDPEQARLEKLPVRLVERASVGRAG